MQGLYVLVQLLGLLVGLGAVPTFILFPDTPALCFIPIALGATLFVAGGSGYRAEGLKKKKRAQLEDKLAAAADTVMNQDPLTTEDPVERLTRLKGMLEAGLISPEEHEAKRAEILAKM